MVMAAFFPLLPMQHLMQHPTQHPLQHSTPDLPRPAWAPLLVLGLSVLASVTLIGAGMALLPSEPESAARSTSARAGAAPGAGQPPAQFPPSASRNTRVRSASAG
jgi:hypothetical protein